MLNDIEIFKRMNHFIDYFKEEYGEMRLLGMSTYGLINYGLAETIEEIDMEVFYIPTFEELVCGDRFVENNISYEGVSIKFTDIRKLTHTPDIAGITAIEGLYTPYYLMNPRYEHIFDNFMREERDDIDQKQRCGRLRAAAQNGLNYLTLVNWDNKYKVLSKHLYYFCLKYDKGYSYPESIKHSPEEIKELLTLKHSEGHLDNSEIEEMKKVFQKILNSPTLVNEESNKKLQKAIIEIIERATDHNTAIVTFENELTDTEKKALREIIKTMSGLEGVIPVTQLSEKTGISKPIFASLITKMRGTEVAQIQSMGSKGTYIKIIKEEILNL